MDYLFFFPVNNNCPELVRIHDTLQHNMVQMLPNVLGFDFCIAQCLFALLKTSRVQNIVVLDAKMLNRGKNWSHSAIIYKMVGESIF